MKDAFQEKGTKKCDHSFGTCTCACTCNSDTAPSESTKNGARDRGVEAGGCGCGCPFDTLAQTISQLTADGGGVLHDLS